MEEEKPNKAAIEEDDLEDDDDYDDEDDDEEEDEEVSSIIGLNLLSCSSKVSSLQTKKWKKSWKQNKSSSAKRSKSRRKRIARRSALTLNWTKTTSISYKKQWEAARRGEDCRESRMPRTTTSRWRKQNSLV
jgi:hypothetical protein